MVRPLNDSPYLYGLHDPGGEHLMAQAGAKGWILFTEELGRDPNNRRGTDYSRWANEGYGIMARLNHGYEPNGTIPHSSHYRDFSQRAANFVAASRGCHIWIIGNEMNFSVERPGVSLDWSSNPPRILAPGEVITPKLYASCYTLCRKAIKALAGHQNDQVITGAVAPWNTQTTYAGNPSGDWVQYQTDLLAELGPAGCDGISIHTYTHGGDPSLIHTDAFMNPPFSHRQYNFRAYQDLMRGIPANMRHLPVYLTETDQNDAWQNINRGWIQRAYGEIEWWNRQAGTQVIRAVILYRWPNVDRWGLEGKTALYEDFRQAMTHKYNWEAAMTTKPSTQPQPQPQPPATPPTTPPASTAVAQPSFTDVTSKLPRDAARFVKRTRADIKYVVINHTGVRPEIGPEMIANAQRQRWPGILSQYFVTADGKIQRTNPELEAVARDQAWIFNGLNIYVAGNFDDTQPSDAQLAALAHLCAWLMDQYDLKTEALRGVSEFIETHSPGRQWLEGARYKDKLLGLAAVIPNSPVQPPAQALAELRAEIDRLKTEVASLAGQLKTLTDSNNTLKQQLKTAEAEKQALQKRIRELEARIAELTSGGTPVAAPAVRDIIDDLAKHETNRYETRSLSAIKSLVVHHSAAGGAISPYNVAAYHVSKDWPGIGYHYYITDDATIYQCNDWKTVSYHVGYANTYSIGICVAGRFMDGAIPPDKQLAAVAHLLAYLSQALKVPVENIKGHKEMPETSTACPGADWLEGQVWKNKLLALVKARLG